ncbi:FecR domain-containing protein [Chryseobacterium sp. JJR-5R]|uniref:FecR family protein n=1 Tax=Chryseobacterium sp. JJR-5R TaxID=3093923 RepID=UPI002A756F33|nr:FecR domain-containing protein [Chryseobacterium sp. JJR-5R]WPO84344.1 FecR domain-containing protein [Chryseobacterium sp. JJR-5R]
MDFENQWKAVSRENRTMAHAADQRIRKGLERRIQLRRNRGKFLAVAAVLVPLFIITGLYFPGNEKSSPVRKEIVFHTSNEKKNFVLPDGTTIILEPQSELKLAQDFGSKTRRVSFTGKAFFSVAKNKNLPFIVDAKGFKVQVLGTRFTLDQKENNRVYLQEGKVKVEYKGHTTYLLPKETWFAGKDGIEKHFYDLDVERKFDFNDVKFSEAVSKLEKTYHITIDYPAEFKNNIIDGDITGNLDKVLQTVSFPFNLRTVKKSENRIILKK